MLEAPLRCTSVGLMFSSSLFGQVERQSQEQEGDETYFRKVICLGEGVGEARAGMRRGRSGMRAEASILRMRRLRVGFEAGEWGRLIYLKRPSVLSQSWWIQLGSWPSATDGKST